MRSFKLGIVVGLVTVGPASAQVPGRANTPVATTIVGFVTDTTGSPISGAAVYIPRIRRQVTADSAGRFRFEDVKVGEYNIAVRRIGYYPQVRTFASARASDSIVFELVPFPRALPPVVTAATGMGLSGIIADSGRRNIARARIAAMGTSQRTVSDSVGHFHLRLKPGKYLLRVEREGYSPVLVSVAIPWDSGRQVSVFLKPTRLSASPIEKAAVFDLRERLTRRSPVTSALVTREDIERHSWSELTDIVNSHAARPVDPGCEAFVDGGPRQTIIWAMRADEVEAVEVYEPQIEVYREGDEPPRMRSRYRRASRPECPYDVYVWLRK